MGEEKEFSMNKDMLEGQLDKLKDVIDGDKKTIAENKLLHETRSMLWENKESGQKPVMRV